MAEPTGNNYHNNVWAQGGSDEVATSIDCTTSTDGNCSLNINIFQATSTDWFVQYAQEQAIATGTTYILSFDAKASVQRTDDVLLQENDRDTLSPSQFHHVSDLASLCELTTSGDNRHSLYEFNLGLTAGHIWIDNVHLFKKQTTKITAPPPHFNGIYELFGDLNSIRISNPGDSARWELGMSAVGFGQDDAFTANGDR